MKLADLKYFPLLHNFLFQVWFLWILLKCSSFSCLCCHLLFCWQFPIRPSPPISLWDLIDQNVCYTFSFIECVIPWSAVELKCTFMSWFVVLEDLHVTHSVQAVCLAAWFAVLLGKCSELSNSTWTGLLGTIKEMCPETFRQTRVLHAQISRKMMTLSLVFLRDAEPGMWSSIHISEGSIWFYLCLSKGDLNPWSD